MLTETEKLDKMQQLGLLLGHTECVVQSFFVSKL